MKKFAAMSILLLTALAVPALAATNPFMDLPMNHWAYDAIGQLAAHGILSGYPDGTYKGKQPTTRYEMASALARALAVVDMTKASKQDVEMLKRLVVEFRDELEALGVKVADLDERVSLIEDRLGGWHIHGNMNFDIENYGDRDAPEAENGIQFDEARLYFERWFGDPDAPMHFVARLDNTNTWDAWELFYVEIPFFFGSTLTAGRFEWDMASAYYVGGDTDPSGAGGFPALDSYLTDREVTGLGLQKQFGLGAVTAYVAHPDDLFTYDYTETDGEAGEFGAWELFLMAQLQFTEQFGFDIGGQAFLGDNAEWRDAAQGMSFDNLWTIFAGLRFDFNESIGLKGIYYHQQMNGDVWRTGASGAYGWHDADHDNANAWKVVVDVKQDLLKFTSLWLEYGQMDRGFFVPAGLTAGAVFAAAELDNDTTMEDDLKYWRAVLGQEWNEKWSSHLFYFGYDFDRYDDLKEWGLGVTYQYDPSVAFGLNFVKVDWDGDRGDDHVVRFRTQVTF